MDDYEVVESLTAWKVRSFSSLSSVSSPMLIDSPPPSSSRSVLDRTQSVNAVHEFRITIRPVEEDVKDHVGIRIHFKLVGPPTPSALLLNRGQTVDGYVFDRLPIRYPKVVPTWTLEEPRGLSSAQVAALVRISAPFASRCL